MIVSRVPPCARLFPKNSRKLDNSKSQQSVTVVVPIQAYNDTLRRCDKYLINVFILYDRSASER